MVKGLPVNLGPCPVPVVGIKQFSKLRAPKEVMQDAWRLIGPSVEKNITRLPLWEVIVTAYLEGMNHGAGITQEAVDKEREIMASKESKYFVPRSSLGKGFDYLYELQEGLIDGTWRTVTETNDRAAVIAHAALIESKGGVVRIIDNSK